MQNVSELILWVETARRNEQYETMQVLAEKVLSNLSCDISAAAWKMRSKLSYEFHMAAYQQAMACEGAERACYLNRSLVLAQQSAKQGDRSGDVLDRLFAEMNISGLLLPALGMWEKGMEMSERVCREAKAIAANSRTTAEDKLRALQVAMNSYFHRIRIIREHGNASPDERTCVAALLHMVEKNQNFITQKDETWAREAVAEAEKFIQG